VWAFKTSGKAKFIATAPYVGYVPTAGARISGRPLAKNAPRIILFSLSPKGEREFALQAAISQCGSSSSKWLHSGHEGSV
jgi:hypothetical protein